MSRHALSAPTKPEVKNSLWTIGAVSKERIAEAAKRVVPCLLEANLLKRGVEMAAQDVITRDQAETMVTMLDAGWTLAAIAAHFGVDVKEVEQAIVKQVKLERNQGHDQRRGK